MRFFSLLLFAVQFMTAIPIKKNFNIKNEDFAYLVCFFPLTAIIVGIISALIFYAFYLLNLDLVGVIAYITAVCIVTGGLHIDGAADFCDAFGAGKDKEKTLEILKDSRVGTFGVIAIVMVLAAKFAMILSLNADIITVIFVLIGMPVAGKIPMAFCGMLGSYPRQDGKAKHFIDLVSGKHTFIGIIICAALLFLMFGLFYALIWVGALLLLGFIMYKVSTKKIGGVTGDILGASNEFGEILFLLVFLIMEALF